MKNAAMPYAIIAILGIVAVIIISVIGLNNRAEIAETDENGEGTEEVAENGEESAEGETANVDADSIYQTNCAACHGADLSGSAGPALAGTSLSEDELKDIITNGTDAGMPAFPEIQGEELDALASWLGEQ